MGHRLSKIVTRTGDAGDTGLTGGGRVPKTHLRVAAMGDVDELNCQVGVLLSLKPPKSITAVLTRIQNELFDLGGELSMPGAVLVTKDKLQELEAAIEHANAKLPPLKEFVLPGGSPAVAAAHVARAVCRRAERAVWALHAEEPMSLFAPQYLNRLSDYLFVCARVLARGKRKTETTWNRRR